MNKLICVFLYFSYRNNKRKRAVELFFKMFLNGKISIMFIVSIHIDFYFGILIMIVGAALYQTVNIYMCIMFVAGI